MKDLVTYAVGEFRGSRSFPLYLVLCLLMWFVSLGAFQTWPYQTATVVGLFCMAAGLVVYEHRRALCRQQLLQPRQRVYLIADFPAALAHLVPQYGGALPASVVGPIQQDGNYVKIYLHVSGYWNVSHVVPVSSIQLERPAPPHAYAGNVRLVLRSVAMVFFCLSLAPKATLQQLLATLAALYHVHSFLH